MDFDGDSDRFPVIVISGCKKQYEVVTYELRRRGFIISGDVDINGNLHIAATMSKKLMVKLAIESDIELKTLRKLDVGQRQTIANKAVQLVLRTKSIDAMAAWIAHDDMLTSAIAAQSGQGQLELVNEYYGSKIALYFGWLDFYTSTLKVPAFVGLLLFVFHYFKADHDSMWVPAFCIGMCLWGTYFLEFWKRRGAELSFAWRVFGIEDNDMDHELAKAAKKETSARVVKQLMSLGAVLCIIFVLVRAMLYYIHAQTVAEERYGSDSYMQWYPTVVYSLLPIVATAIFDPISHMLNDNEEHTTQADAEDALIMKKFALQFVNRYCALIYTAFWLRDMDQLRALLISLLTTGAIIGNILELGLPYVTVLYGKSTSQKAAAASDAETAKPSSPKHGDQSVAPKELSAAEKDQRAAMRELLLLEVSRAQYDLKEDYLEMVLQYGYISMFAAAFPLAPLLAYVNNLFEGRVDLAKLTEVRRPPIELRSNIGAWQTCLEIVSFASVLTNCFLLSMVSSHLHTVLPVELTDVLHSQNGKLLCMLLIEHVLVGIKVLMMVIIDDVPQWVREAVAVERVEEQARAVRSKLHEHAHNAAARVAHQRMMDNVDNVNNDLQDGSSASELLGSKLHPSQGGNISPAAASKNLALSRLVSECNTQFGFDPIFMCVMVVLPLALHLFGVTPWLYIPAAVLFFSYMQAKKDRQDRKAAIGIVSDPALVRMVVEEMPSWVKDSDFQRVEWLNSILQKIWPKISAATEDVVFAAVQPILKANTPIFLSGLWLTKFHLGNISPKLIGVRFFDTEESSVRFDVELRWAGDPIITLKVGTRPMPITVEVAELRISAVLRVELLELKSAFPCFKALSITCMKKPLVDFSLKLAKLDLMNIGASDYSVAKVVKNLLQGLIENAVLFPNKYLLQMEKDGDVGSANPANLHPVGILSITFERAIGLKQANVFGSDPYVEIRPQPFGEVLRTSTKINTLNPEWNETFDFMIHDKATQRIDLAVFDYDMANMDTLLGRASIDVSKLANHQQTQRHLTLTGVDKGVLVVWLHYIPIASSTSATKKQQDNDDNEETADILYDVSRSELQDNEILFSDETMHIEDVAARAPNLLERDSFSDLSASVQNGSRPLLPKRQLTQKFKSVRGNLNGNNVVEAVGVLAVSQMRVVGLKSPTFLGMNDSSFRPFISCAVGNTTKDTKYLKNNRQPNFTESFSFVVKDPDNEQLRVRVMDRNKWTSNRLIGTVDISISEVVASNSGALEQKYMLEGEGLQECHVLLKLVWFSSTK